MSAWLTFQDAVVVNSLLLGHGTLASGALVENSRLTGSFNVHAGAVVSGVRSVHGLTCLPGIVFQETAIDWNKVMADTELRPLLRDTSGTVNGKEGSDKRVWVLTTFGVFDNVSKRKCVCVCVCDCFHCCCCCYCCCTPNGSAPASPLRTASGGQS